MHNKTLFISAALASAMTIHAGVTDITPRPASLSAGEGQYVLPSALSFDIKADPADSLRIATYINDEWRPYRAAAPGAVRLISKDAVSGVTTPEGYKLSVTPDGVDITATTGQGLFYGLQTLMQLAAGSDTIPALEITDNPRLPYRGMMLDISRHFRDKDFIKKQIDAIAKLKINRLHLHLTDAAGWRLEIKRYPRLTDFAAWRPQATWKEWNEGGNLYTDKSSPDAHGGYLTQDDAREIVKYAADRYITVIPEIEMPSHSEEVNAAYPELSCTHKQYGQPDFCVGNEKTFEFLQNVLDEVMEIFPSVDIHVGGDEAPKTAWKDCELCQARMKAEGLENVDELQSYLIHRIEKYLNSKGRNLMGWDEIMEGGLAPNATVMSWRGVEGGIKAARSGHRAIMSPGAYCYLDSYQDAPQTQPEAIGGYTPLSTVYSYDPVPDSLAAEVKPWIYGVQGNLWCEYIPTAEHAEYMLYPRMTAIAEIGWTPQELRDWDDFSRRAADIADRMRADGYNTFDIRTAHGNKPEYNEPAQSIAIGKKVTYNIPWWNRYTAGGDTTLTDGLRGGWNYTDGRWQGFLHRGDNRLDVTVDLGSVTEISYIGAEFMQIVGPGVWLPATVIISVSADGKDYTELKRIDHEQVRTDGLSFKTFDWTGQTRARYIRYRALSNEGCLFTDEIIVR